MKVRYVSGSPDRDVVNHIIANLNMGIGFRPATLEGVGEVTLIVYTVGIEPEDGGETEYDQEVLALICNPEIAKRLTFPGEDVMEGVTDVAPTV